MIMKEICKFCVLIAFLCVSFTSNAQNIKWVDMKYQADVNVYFTNWKYQADAIVYVTPYRPYNKELGIWFVNAYPSRKNVKVRVVKYKYQADLIVYVTDWRHQVRVNEKYKKYFIK